MSDAGWIHPGPISPLDCDQADCGWRVHGVPDQYHANALARHTAEAHQTAEAARAGDDVAMQTLSDAGAQCGICGDQPGDRICPDCERCYEEYVKALRRAGWTSRAEVLREAAATAESLRQFNHAIGARKSAQVSENVGILRVADELRRMADEATPGGAA